jgi:hypothetical protein
MHNIINEKIKEIEKELESIIFERNIMDKERQGLMQQGVELQGALNVLREIKQKGKVI